MVVLMLAMGVASPYWMRAIDTHGVAGLANSTSQFRNSHCDRSQPWRRSDEQRHLTSFAFSPKSSSPSPASSSCWSSPLMPPATSRKSLGWLAILGVAGRARRQLLPVPACHPAHAFFGIIQIDAFSVFFHLLIGGIVLASLLIARHVSAHTSSLGEYFALVLLRRRRHDAHDLRRRAAAGLHRPRNLLHLHLHPGRLPQEPAKGPEAALKYFLLGSFATAFFLYGIALVFGATGSTSIAAIADGLATSQTRSWPSLGLAMILIGLGFKVSAAPFHVWTPDVYQGAPSPVVGAHVHRTQGRRLRRPAPHPLRSAPRTPRITGSRSSGGSPSSP